MTYSVDRAYFRLAESCDDVGPSNRELFLAKLALLLAEEVHDIDRLEKAIAAAKVNLGREMEGSSTRPADV